MLTYFTSFIEQIVFNLTCYVYQQFYTHTNGLWDLVKIQLFYFAMKACFGFSPTCIICI